MCSATSSGFTHIWKAVASVLCHFLGACKMPHMLHLGILCVYGWPESGHGLNALWHVVRVCWCMVRALSSVPCTVTITAWSEQCDGGHQNQQPQLCSEMYETIYVQGGAHFHLIGSSCFSLLFSEKYWGLTRCHGLVSASEILATYP